MANSCTIKYRYHCYFLPFCRNNKTGVSRGITKGGEDMFGMHRDRITPKWQKRISFQRIVQLLSLVLINGYMVGFQKGKIFTGKSKAICVPVLNCYSCPGALGACPIGALQTALGGKHHFPFYIFGLLMLFGIVLGRVICGFLCPFGLVQDLIHKIPTFKWHIPKKIDKPLRYLKYIILLVMIIFLPAFLVTKTGIVPPYFCKYLCPSGTLFGGIPQMIANPELRKLAGILFHWKILVLILILILSILINRPFCRYLCPLGAFYSIFNRFSFYQMHLEQLKCIHCKKCEYSCPMQVEVTKDINGLECIRCGKCRSVCPTKAISGSFLQNKDIL